MCFILHPSHDHFRYEYPGRYTMWDKAFVNPPIMISSQADTFTVVALNARGDVLVPGVEKALAGHSAIESIESETSEAGRKSIKGKIIKSDETFTEEERSKQPSIFSVVRGIIDLFFSDKDTNLGLYV